MVNKVSLRPSEFVEGGAVPVDKDLLWKECRFALFDYTKKTGEVVATTIAARITYQDKEGAEYIQHYSAGDPERFKPSEDGKSLVPQGTNQALAKSSNYYLLMNALVNCGFPEDKISDDISELEGLETFNIGMPEPKRVGLKRAEPVEGARERIISIPSKINKLPWEKKGKAGAVAAKKAAPAAEVADESKDALALVKDLLEKNESVTRQQAATAAIRAKKSGVAKFVYTDEFQAALLGGGYNIDGENITKA